jgi:hemolysin III
MVVELERPPLLRGVFHLGAFVAAVGAGVVLVVLADGGTETASSWIYGATLVAMFGVSALYHRFPWRSAAERLWARRLDHSTIFVFIAGTYTPFALLCLDGVMRWVVLAVVWAGALLGLALALGAVIYATKWPDPFPRIFGYHEVFHLLVVVAAVTQFVAVSLVVM